MSPGTILWEHNRELSAMMLSELYYGSDNRELSAMMLSELYYGSITEN